MATFLLILLTPTWFNPGTSRTVASTGRLECVAMPIEYLMPTNVNDAQKFAWRPARRARFAPPCVAPASASRAAVRDLAEAGKRYTLRARTSSTTRCSLPASGPKTDPYLPKPPTLPHTAKTSAPAMLPGFKMMRSIAWKSSTNLFQAALVALGRLDQTHAMVYFQVIWNGLREPMRQALGALVMERQIEGEATFPPFVRKLIDRGMREGELEGLREGKLEGKRDTLLRLLSRAGIGLTEDESARIQACTDVATLDRWIDNVVGAKTATEVLS
ncbi:hypothetical protein WME76_35285 [Sorangium sp. So ce119]|uniref:hypothetical protein n=1 Tax=Sorangium sp. So ce119 TaxID=3133279 RepID=UPI003F61F8C2